MNPESPLSQRHQRIVETLNRRQPDLTVLMEQVHKPHNFSAILRTCDAVGVLEAHAIPGPEGFRAASSVTQGAHKWVPVRRHPDAPSALAALRQQEFKTYAAHFSSQAVDFRSLEMTEPCAFVLGTERHGVSERSAAAVDGHIIIPMLGMAQSLNVSVACAVILFEAQRQRAKAGYYNQPRLNEDHYQRLLFEWLHPKLAQHCQRHGVEYPELGEQGEVIGDVPRG